MFIVVKTRSRKADQPVYVDCVLDIYGLFVLLLIVHTVKRDRKVKRGGTHHNHVAIGTSVYSSIYLT